MTFSWYFFGAASSLSMLWPSQFIFHFYCLSPVGKKIRHQWIITLIMTPFDGASSLCHFFSSTFDDAQSSGQFHFHFSDHKSNVVHNLYWFYDLAQMQHHKMYIWQIVPWVPAEGKNSKVFVYTLEWIYWRLCPKGHKAWCIHKSCEITNK